MTKPKTPPTDDTQIRCPRLGHQIQFSYCRIENTGKPCFKVLDCWNAYFDVEAYLRQELPEDQVQDLLCRKPKPKINSLLELIEQAKKAK